MAKSRTAARSGLAAWAAFLIAHAAAMDALEQEHTRCGLIPLAWFDVLATLNSVPGGTLRMHELADSIVLSRSGLTRLVDRIQAAGLVKRETCKSDRRGLMATLTDSGRKALAEAAPAHLRAVEEHFMSYLTPAEADVLATALSKVLVAHGRRPRAVPTN